MKSRPRSVEREVALHLTRFAESCGASPVERIPVLGRTGPDLTTNELGLVIDVKSRLEVPKSYFQSTPTLFGTLVALPLDGLLRFAAGWELVESDARSVLVERWFAHMDEWRVANLPGGTTVLVLHRPKKPVGKAMLVLHQNSVEELKCRILHLLRDHPTI